VVSQKTQKKIKKTQNERRMGHQKDYPLILGKNASKAMDCDSFCFDCTHWFAYLIQSLPLTAFAKMHIKYQIPTLFTLHSTQLDIYT